MPYFVLPAICTLLFFLVSSATIRAQGSSTLTNFNGNGNQVTRFDSVAAAIDAHDGEISYFNGVFYLYGTSYGCGYEWGKAGAPFCGFEAYSSTDLVNWTERGFLFDAQTSLWQSRCNGSTYGCYRPHVVFNKTNNLYVLWINVYDNVSGYRVFTSTNPIGPFTETAQPTLAVNSNAPAGGLNNGDHDVFVDDDGTAYLAFTDWRAGGAITIEKLNADYTSGSGEYVQVTPGQTEAPALMKRNGKYYLLYSDPNCGYCGGTGTSYRTATSPLGPWSSGIKISTNSCGGQPSFVSTIKLDSQVVFLYGSDLWNNGAGNEALANFYWAPLTFATDGSINPITCQDKVSLSIPPDATPPPILADLDCSSGDVGFTSFGDIGGNIQRSQSFVATRAGNLGVVSFCTFQTGHPDAGLTIQIYRADNAGLPTGAALSSILVLPEIISWAPKFVTVSPGIAVTAGTAYVIVAKSAASSGHYGFEYDDSDPYPAGKAAYSNDGGNTFSEETNRSLMFRTFVQTLNITTTNETGLGVGTFYPSWTARTNGSLIAEQPPTTAVGNFSLEASGRSVQALTISNDLGITLINGPNGFTASTNYVTCGSAGGAGSTLIYSLPDNGFGYDLTNITVCGGWIGNAQDQQAYTVYYSTVDASSNFVLLASVNYDPPAGENVQSATRVTMASSSGVLAKSVAAVKFDFTSPSSRNGFSGYGAIGVFGAPTTNLPAITANTIPATAADVVGDSVTFAVGTSGKMLNRQWQKIVEGITNDIAGATNSTLVLTNLQLSDSASYQLRATNIFGSAVSMPASLTVSSLPPPVNNIIIATAGQAGSGSGTFYPTWTVQTNRSLIAGQLPTTAVGDFSKEAPGRSAAALTSSNNLGIMLITYNGSATSSTNYVTCGDGYGAGSILIYSLTNNAPGCCLTNITVYGGWANNGRDQQAYTIYYSTKDAPSTFIQLGVVNYNPTIGGGVPSATRVTLTSTSGVLATNVTAVKFDFTSPASENGYCGYAGIAIFGSVQVPPVVPMSVSTGMYIPGSLIINIWNLMAGRNYKIQSTTNLASPAWVTETNLTATQTAVSITNVISEAGPKFYRVNGY